MRKYLLSEEGNFYKANLHCHTNVSDGKLSPEEVKELYKSHGYSVVAYTDHDVMIPHPDLADDDFLPLVGLEMEIDEGPFTKDTRTCHFCAIAGSPDIKRQPCFNAAYANIGNAAKYVDLVQRDENAPPYKREYTSACISDMMQKCRDAGFFVTYNHPVWSLENYPIYTSYHGMHAMEIVNYACCTLGLDEHNGGRYDDVLRSGERIYAVCADDNHNARLDSCGAYVMIKAKELEYTAITDALFRGDFYASTGPEIKELYFEGKTLCITSSDAVSITATTGCRRAKIKCASDCEPLNYASFDFEGTEGYVRVTVTDKSGEKAYSRAYFFDEIFEGENS